MAIKTSSTDDKIAESIMSLVELRKKEAEQETVEAPEGKLKYLSMYINLDRMLKTLPESTVEELNFQFICQIREIMQSYGCV